MDEKIPVKGLLKPALVLEKLQALKTSDGKVIDFILEPNFNTDFIIGLVNLPYEIALTKYQKRLYLSTNPDSEQIRGSHYLERRAVSKLNFHTHPQDIAIIANAPSFADLWVLEYNQQGIPAIIAHPKGILVYQLPTRDIRIGNKTISHNEPRWIAQRWGELKYGIDIMGFGGRGFKTTDDLPLESHYKIAREFAEESGMIIDEYEWSDTKVDALIRQINTM